MEENGDNDAQIIFYCSSTVIYLDLTKMYVCMSYMVVMVLYSVMVLANQLTLELGNAGLIKDHNPIILDVVPAV